MPDKSTPELIPSSQVRSRYGGVSHMWIERRLRADPRFPRPVYIGRRRYWRLAELETYERALATAQPANAA